LSALLYALSDLLVFRITISYRMAAQDWFDYVIFI